MNNPFASATQERSLSTYILWITTAAWAVTIFSLSTERFGGAFTTWLTHEVLRLLEIRLDPDTFATVHSLIRKLAHLTEFFLFATLLYGSLKSGKGLVWRGRTAFRTFIICALYAASDEFHQWFVPGRTPSVVDCAVDVAGASLAILLLYACSRLFPAKESSPAAATASTAET